MSASSLLISISALSLLSVTYYENEGSMPCAGGPTFCRPTHCARAAHARALPHRLLSRTRMLCLRAAWRARFLFHAAHLTTTFLPTFLLRAACVHYRESYAACGAPFARFAALPLRRHTYLRCCARAHFLPLLRTA